MTTLFGYPGWRLHRLLPSVFVVLWGLPTRSVVAESRLTVAPTPEKILPSCTKALAPNGVDTHSQLCQFTPASVPFTVVIPSRLAPLAVDTETEPISLAAPAISTEPLADTSADALAQSSVQPVDVDPAIVEGSPVLQRWLEEVPDLAVDIHHDPAFRTRVRVGYATFPSTDNTGGVYVGVQDVFVGRTPLTLSAEYATNSSGDRQLIGADAQYYLLPLGWYGNVAPVVGYRHIQSSAFESQGVNVGLRIILIPSRTGTADLSVTQSWVAPGSGDEVSLTTFAAGYAIAEDLRVGTDIQIQNTRERQESQVGVLLEWML